MSSEALDWDDEVPAEDLVHFELLEPGIYQFEIVNLERGIFPGSAKLEQCNKAILTLKINSCDIKTDLILNKKLAWKIDEFAVSIGNKKHGEALSLKSLFKDIIGKKGWCEIDNRSFVGKDGTNKTANEVKKFIEKPVETARATKAKTEPKPAVADDDLDILG